jgi:hypothetical protein
VFRFLTKAASTLNLDGAAVGEVTSEEKDYPVESALVSGQMLGWRAADVGVQTIRLVFDESQILKRITLIFEETEVERNRRVCFEMVWRLRGLVSRDCAPAVEFQSP